MRVGFDSSDDDGEEGSEDLGVEEVAGEEQQNGMRCLYLFQ